MKRPPQHVLADDSVVEFKKLLIKAKEKISIGRKVSLSIETKYLDYYEKCRLPVVIVFWIKQENAFYHVYAQRYINEFLSVKDPSWRKKKTKTIVTTGYLYLIQE